LLRRNMYEWGYGVYGRYINDLPSSDDGLPAEAGWSRLSYDELDGLDGLFKPLLVRAAGEGRAEALIETGPRSRNSTGGLHGAFLSAMAEKTLFLPLFVHGRVGTGGVVAVDFSLQFLSGGDVTRPMLAEIELLRETGRMAFVRGLLRQDGLALVGYSGTLRKLSPPR
jgi:acyl-coenzyme A thioesterase PaaI-like protein